MPRVSREDGVEISWRERGEGPAVVIVPHFAAHPSVFDPLTEELAKDHRVVNYDARGTGESTRAGPHDMETGAEDLGAVLDAVGEPAVLVALADGGNRAARALVSKPELARAAVLAATAPIRVTSFEGTDSLASSETVINAFIDQLGTDYRAAVRTMTETGNPQMTEDEIRERVRAQVEYSPAETTIGRIREWIADDPRTYGEASAERLTLVFSPNAGGPWFPNVEEMEEILSRELPGVPFEVLADGIVSRPDLTADVVRRITAG